MSLSSKVHAVGRRMQRRLRGEAVTFARGDVSVVLQLIVRGRTEWKGFGKGGAVVISESADFLIPAALLIAGGLAKPNEGDKITVTTDTLVSVYDVQPFGPDRLSHRWHDRDDRTVYRIFTKLFSEDAVE